MSAVSIRPGVASDSNFLFSSLLRSFRESDAVGLIPMELYYKVFHEVVVLILSRPGIEILVATNPGMEPPNDIQGFVLWEKGPFFVGGEKRKVTQPAVHYVYVKRNFRGWGVGKALLRAAVDPGKPFFYTFATTAGDALLRSTRAVAVHKESIVRYPKVPKDHERETQCD